MDTPNLPPDSAFRVTLPTFEGPLDLLLHLARKHELDILDLPIAFVTERYLEYLNLMQELDLDVASEYLLMAATLAHIKSKMLLPPTPGQDDDESEDEYMEDPRAELIRRLLEYQKYKHAAADLGGRALAGRDVFTRGTPAPVAQGEAPLAEVSLFKLLDAFEGILKRVRGQLALEVTSERITIQERMTQITELLRERRSCTFEELFEEDITRYEVVVTFLALLEMTKMHVTRLYQADPESPIHVQFALLDPNAPTIPPEGIAITSDGGADDELAEANAPGDHGASPAVGASQAVAETFEAVELDDDADGLGLDGLDLDGEDVDDDDFDDDELDDDGLDDDDDGADEHARSNREEDAIGGDPDGPAAAAEGDADSDGNQS